MSDRVTPPRKTLVDLIKESAAVSSGKRANALLAQFRKAYPELAKHQTEVVKPGEFRGQVHDAVFVDEACHISDAMKYGSLADRLLRMPSAQRIPVQIKKPLSEFATAELVMELLGRGFAVQKVPEPKA